MEAPRPGYRELSDPKNREILANNSPKIWRCYQKSMNRARFFSMEEKVVALQRALLETAGFDGRSREDLRDAVQGVKPLQMSLAGPREPTAPHL